MKLKFNKEKFLKMTRIVPRKDIAERLGISLQAVYNRLTDNIDNIRLREFLAICEVMEIHPNEFLEEEE